MDTLEKVDSLFSGSAKPYCTACRKEMWLLRIEPDEPGYEVRTFECAGCAYRERLQTLSP